MRGSERAKCNRILILLGVLLFFVFPPVAGSELDEEIEALEDFSEAYALIKRQYVSYRNPEQLIRPAIDGMLKSLDPYSSLLTKEEMNLLELHSVGQYVGIGVTVQKSRDQFVITQVFENSPAELAGIRPGDIITGIGSTDLKGKSGEEINRLMIGELNSPIELEFHHAEEPEKPISRIIERAVIKANSVQCGDTMEGFLLLTVHQFAKHTAREISDCLKGKTEQPIILDLRNNPGGLLISAVEVAELFVDTGDVVKIKNREGITLETYIARRKAYWSGERLFVLINRFSASAAEILAGAIKDRNAGVLIGETSYGKGVVQSIFPLGSDLYVKLTTARYYTPSGIEIDGHGIAPDLELEDSLKPKRYDAEDRIFNKALELIQGETAVQLNP